MLNSKELLEQANQRVVTINKLMGEIESFDGIMSAGRDGEVAFYTKGTGTTYIDGVLSQDKMQELKETVINAIVTTRDEKTTELEQLLGIKKLPPAVNLDFEEKSEPLQIPKRKPATINPEFEQAINKTIQTTKATNESLEELSDKAKTVANAFKESVTDVCCNEVEEIKDKPEMTVELVKELYHDKNMTLDAVASELGTNRTALYKFVTKHNLRKPSKKDRDTFRDGKVKKERP